MEVAEANGVQKSSTSMSENSSEVKQNFQKSSFSKHNIQLQSVPMKLAKKKHREFVIDSRLNC